MRCGYDINVFMQERCNSSANALELHLFCIKPLLYMVPWMLEWWGVCRWRSISQYIYKQTTEHTETTGDQLHSPGWCLMFNNINIWCFIIIICYLIHPLTHWPPDEIIKICWGFFSHWKFVMMLTVTGSITGFDCDPLWQSTVPPGMKKLASW